ncbi:MAG: hypothetical protein H0X39_05555 [Actinobacteria bacterium]|nr:hypothetical protein [Actinomycetota bacterium]
MSLEPEHLARELLGWPERMISGSKSGYRERHPNRLPIFNANVCLADQKLWHGDLDLTTDEPKLIALANKLGRAVFVLWEGDGRFENAEKPLVEEAIYCAFPEGHGLFDRQIARRGSDGVLRRVPPKPTRTHLVTPDNWDGSRRPKLLRFWQLELVHSGNNERINHLLYIGEQDHKRRSPRLILGIFRSTQEKRSLTIELTWYPTRREHLSSPRPQRTARFCPASRKWQGFGLV